MAKFTQDMGDISVQHIKPIADKSGYTEGAATASLIKNVGNLGLEAVKGYHVAEAEVEYETLANEIKQADAQYSMQDVMQIEDFSQRMTAFRDMAAQGKKSDEMKLRAEALLKQQIARMPGLEKEFRQSAASIIGIDPAGQGVKTAFANMAKEEADAERILTQVSNDSVTSFGMLPGEVYTKPGQEKYMALNSLRAKNKMAEMELTQLETVAKIGAVKQGVVDTAKVKHFTDPSVQIGYNATSRVSAENTVRKFLGGAEINAQNIAALSQDDRTALITELKRSQRASASVYEGYASGFKTRDQFEDIQTRILAPFQDYIDLVEGKTTVDSLTNWNTFQNQSIVNELYKAPEAKAYVAVSEILKNSNAPPEVFNKMYDIAKGMKTFAPALPSPDSPNKQPDTPSKEAQQAASANDVRSLVQPLTQILSNDGTTEESRNTSIKIIENMATMLEDGDSYKPEVVDTFIDVLNTPTTAEGMRRALQSAPQAKMAINDLMAKHVQRAGNGTANSIQRLLESTSYPSDVESVDSTQTTAFVYPELQGDQVVVRINERAATEWALNNQLTNTEQKNMMRNLKKKMARINAGPISSLNKIISATSNLYNQPSNEVAVKVLKRAGRLSQQISNLPLPTPEEDMGVNITTQERVREVERGADGKLRFK